jgi:3-oxoacyl-[acyl-carrier-protein] synthase II
LWDRAADLGCIAAHGTGTVYSDAMEMVAFRGAIPQNKPVFSVKGGIGHTLAAAGLVQILVTGRAMAEGKVPPTVGLSEPDESATGWATTAVRTIDRPSPALSTNSGFGGVNTAIILGGKGLQ